MKTSFNRDYDHENVLSVRLKEAAVAMYNISLRISSVIQWKGYPLQKN